MVEQRKTARALTHLDGRVALDRVSHETQPCLVRNLSPIGACLTLCARMAVPDAFALYLGADPRPYWVRRIWHRANEVGISFVEARGNAPEVLSDTDLLA